MPRENSTFTRIPFDLNILANTSQSHASTQEARQRRAQKAQSQWMLVIPHSYLLHKPPTDSARPCKNRKIKCGEERPQCLNCDRQGETCDYSIRLNWDGRTKRKNSNEDKPLSHASSPPLSFERSASHNSDSTIRGSSPNPMGSFVVNQFSSPNPTTTIQAPPPYRDHISTSQLSRIRDQSAGPYPSPADSSIDSPPPNTLNYQYASHQYNSDMPPPFSNPVPSLPAHGYIQSTYNHTSADRQAKRMRLSPSAERLDSYQQHEGPVNPVLTNGMLNAASMASPYISHKPSSPSNTNLRVPPTPAASVGSEENHNPIPGPSPQSLPQESPDFRRLSVKSLLSDDSPAESTSGSDGNWPGKLDPSSFNSIEKTKYGIDRGFPDLDLPNNQDSTALNGVTPTMGLANLDNQGYESGNDLFSGFGFGVNTSEGFREGAAYYAKPVTVSISKSLEPLPSILKDNPMNLLYFHHFLNHTARILVPHDCSENPFRSILPRSKQCQVQYGYMY